MIGVEIQNHDIAVAGRDQMVDSILIGFQEDLEVSTQG
jgi:hypothetical protein